MSHSKSYEFLLKDISTLKRVGQKTKKMLKKKKIETLFDVLLHLPQAFVDRSNLININKLEIGKISTIKVQVIKYNIPRITIPKIIDHIAAFVFINELNVSPNLNER